MTAAPFGMRRADYVRVRALAEKELRGPLTTAEIAELRSPERTGLWMRVLTDLLHDVENRISDGHVELAKHPLKPPPGAAASQDWLEAKTAWRERQARRRHWRSRVLHKRTEVASIITDNGSITVPVVDVVVQITHALGLLSRDEVGRAEGLLSNLLARLTRESCGAVVDHAHETGMARD